MNEAEQDTLRVTFKPREGALLTDFEIKYEDVPHLIQMLITSNSYRSPVPDTRRVVKVNVKKNSR